MRTPYSTSVSPIPAHHPAAVQGEVLKRISENKISLYQGTQQAYEQFMAVKLLGPMSDEAAASIVMAGALIGGVQIAGH